MPAEIGRSVRGWLQRLDQIVIECGFGLAGELADRASDQVRNDTAHHVGDKQDTNGEEATANWLAQKSRAEHILDLRPVIVERRHNAEIVGVQALALLCPKFHRDQTPIVKRPAEAAGRQILHHSTKH